MGTNVLAKGMNRAMMMANPALRFHKGLSPHEIFRFEEAGLFFLEQASTDSLAERVADRVADHRGDEADRYQNPDIEDVLGCQKAGSEKQAVTGQEKADQQPGFRKNDGEDPDVPDRLDQFLEIYREHRDIQLK